MRLEIELNKPTVLYPGQRVTGTIHIIAQIKGIVKSLKLNICGNEETSWYHGISTTKNDAIDYSSYSSSLFLNAESFLIGGLRPPLQVHPGVTSLSFDFKLPRALPSSYKGVHGHVEYSVEAQLEANGIEKERRVFFDVRGIYNLGGLPSSIFNSISDYQELFTLNWRCRGNGKVELELYVPRIAFAPGEKIPFHAQIWNRSPFHIKNIQICLIRYVTYRIKGSIQQEGEFKVFLLRKSEGIGPGEEDVFKSDSNDFRVPKDCVPTNLGRSEGSGLISVRYSILLKIRISSAFTQPLTSEIPIYIGGVAKRIPTLDPLLQNDPEVGSEISFNHPHHFGRALTTSLGKFKSKLSQKRSKIQ